MSTQLVEDRGVVWPLAFGLIGTLNLLDYFYKLSFQPDDLLQGLGFLFFVPLAYLNPASFRFTRRRDPIRAVHWPKWLAAAGLVLLIVGLAVQWL